MSKVEDQKAAMKHNETRLADLDAQLRYQWSVIGEAMFNVQNVQTRIDEVKQAIVAEQQSKADEPPKEPDVTPETI